MLNLFVAVFLFGVIMYTLYSMYNIKNRYYYDIPAYLYLMLALNVVLMSANVAMWYLTL